MLPNIREKPFAIDYLKKANPAQVRGGLTTAARRGNKNFFSIRKKTLCMGQYSCNTSSRTWASVVMGKSINEAREREKWVLGKRKEKWQTSRGNFNGHLSASAGIKNRKINLQKWYGENA